jgi:hypothetical protein
MTPQLPARRRATGSGALQYAESWATSPEIGQRAFLTQAYRKSTVWSCSPGCSAFPRVALGDTRRPARTTPDEVADRLQFLSFTVGGLSGAYNEIGIRQWFDRGRFARHMIVYRHADSRFPFLWVRTNNH